MFSPSGTLSRLQLSKRWLLGRGSHLSAAAARQHIDAFTRSQLTGSRFAHFLILVCGGALVCLLHAFEHWGWVAGGGLPDVVLGAGVAGLLLAAYASLYGEPFPVRVAGILVYMPLLGFLVASAAPDPVSHAERLSLFLLFPLISITLTIRVLGVVAIALASGSFLAYHAHAHPHAASVLLWLQWSLAVVFGAVLRHFRMRLAMHSHLRRIELQTRVRTDSLTGLHNRNGWNELAPGIIAEGVKRGRPVFVLFFDVDRFKLVNDVYGHAAGDDVLQRLAALMSRLRPVRSIAARLGGEEFVVITAANDPEEVTAFAQNVRAGFADLESSRGITVSVGIARIRDGESLGGVMKRADQALYRAKQEGRNRINWA